MARCPRSPQAACGPPGPKTKPSLLRLRALLFGEGTTSEEPWKGHPREWFTRHADDPAMPGSLRSRQTASSSPCVSVLQKSLALSLGPLSLTVQLWRIILVRADQVMAGSRAVDGD